VVRVTPAARDCRTARRNEKDQPKTRKEWKTAHKGECAHVQPAVVVDASGLHDQAVGAKLVCANTKCDVHFGAKPGKSAPTNTSPAYLSSVTKESSADKAKREAAERLEREREIAGGAALFEAILGKVTAITQPELEFLIGRIIDNADINAEAEAVFAKFFGWQRPENAAYLWLGDMARKMSGKMGVTQKAQLLVGLAIVEGVDGNSYGPFERDDLEKLAKKYKLDPKAIIEKAEADVEKRQADLAQTSAKLAPAKGAQARRAAAPQETAAGGSHPHPTKKPPSPPKKSSPKKATKKAASPKKKGGR
jgi:hypothetical protein